MSVCFVIDFPLLITMKLKLLALLLLASSLVGCTAIREADAKSKEKLLMAAGFQARPATTEQQQAALAALTPYRIETRTKNGALYYVYADPRGQSVLVGGPAEYASYLRMAQQQSVVDQEQFAMASQEMKMDEWSNWGPWAFGGVPMPERIE